MTTTRIPLTADNLDTEPEGILPAHIAYLRANNYAVERIHSPVVVHRDGSETGHLVLKVDTYHMPRDHPGLDVAAQRVTVPVCDCGDFTYRKSADISKEAVSPAESEPCAHIRLAYKEFGAAADASQKTLV